MALTEHVKRTVVNVSLPEGDPKRVQYEYYDDVEWATVVAAREAAVVPNARQRRKEVIGAEAQSLVDAIMAPDALLEAQLRTMELLDKKIDKVITAPETAELDVLKQKRSDARGIRVREKAANAAIDTAATVEEVEAVVL